MKSCVALFLLCTTKFSFAQTELPKALVITITGNASIYHNNKPKQLKQYQQIFSNDVIHVKKATIIELIDIDGQSVTINQPGSYNYKTLKQNLKEKPNNIVAKFFNMLWDDFFRPPPERIPVTEKSIGIVSGGSPRGNCNSMIDPLDKSKLCEDTITFRWHPVIGYSSYQFTLEDEQRNEILNIILKDTVIIFLKRGLLKDVSNAYSWKVIAEQSQLVSCAQVFNSFTIAAKSERDRQVNEIIAETARNTDEFIFYMNISKNLALKGWHHESFEYYKKAKDILLQSVK